MGQINIPIAVGSLPQGFCPSTYQQMVNAFGAIMSVAITQQSGATPIVISATKPTDTSVLWQQLDTLGRPTRLYWFAQGSWLSLHTMVPGLITPWIGALPNFNVFDGGDSNAASNTSGPMWELVTELQGKFPVGAGALTSGAVVNEGDTGGNDLQPKLQDHTHTTGRFRSDGDDKIYLIEPALTPTAGLTGAIVDRSAPSAAKLEAQLDTLTGDWTGTSTVNNMPDPNTQTILPPYRGINFIRRTSRLFYSVT